MAPGQPNGLADASGQLEDGRKDLPSLRSIPQNELSTGEARNRVAMVSKFPRFPAKPFHTRPAALPPVFPCPRSTRAMKRRDCAKPLEELVARV